MMVEALGGLGHPSHVTWQVILSAGGVCVGWGLAMMVEAPRLGATALL
jgi:hypothetical protein